MTNRPKNIGTAAETAVVRAARAHGFPAADRLTLTGALDRGDIGLCPGVILEVKAGERAKNASDLLIHGWLAETERERINAGATVGMLVTSRRGLGAPNAHRWWAHMPGGLYAALATRTEPHYWDHVAHPVRIHLESALRLLRHYGYGDPLEPDPEVPE